VDAPGLRPGFVDTFWNATLRGGISHSAAAEGGVPGAKARCAAFLSGAICTIDGKFVAH